MAEDKGQLSRGRDSTGTWAVVWGGALLLLVVNDHWLKGSGVLPGAITGKLSDFAGPVVAPWVVSVGLSTLLRVTPRVRPAPPRVRANHGRTLIATVLVGLVFAAIQLSRGAAELLINALHVIGVSWNIWSDPSDLVGLVTLPLGYRAACALEGASCSLRPPGFAKARVALGAFACVATGTPAPPYVSSYGFLLNDTALNLTVQVNTMTGRMRCGSVTLDPNLLFPSDFRPANESPIPSGQLKQLNDSDTDASNCMPVRVAIWDPQNRVLPVSAVLGFTGGGRSLTGGNELQEARSDGRAVVLVQEEAGQLRLKFGEGIYAVVLAEGSAAVPPTECAEPTEPTRFGGAKSVRVEEIRPLAGNCVAYLGAAIDASGGTDEAGENGGASAASGSIQEGGAGGRLNFGGSLDAGGQGGAVGTFGSVAMQICTDAPLDIRLGSLLALQEGSPTSTSELRANTRLYVDEQQVLEVGTVVTLRYRQDCTQVRANCGAIFVRMNPLPPISAGISSQAFVDEGTLETLLTRPQCQGSLATVGATGRYRLEAP